MTGGDISSFLLDVRKGEESVVTFHLPTEPLKPALGWSRYWDTNLVPTSM